MKPEQITAQETTAHSFDYTSSPYDELTRIPEKVATVEPIDSLQESLGPLYKVAKCESGLRQFNSDGSVLRGRQNSQDVGILQINERYHLEASRKMGYDIHTTKGNIDYGLYLYKHQGLTPWNWSKECWSK